MYAFPPNSALFLRFIGWLSKRSPVFCTITLVLTTVIQPPQMLQFFILFASSPRIPFFQPIFFFYHLTLRSSSFCTRKPSPHPHLCFRIRILCARPAHFPRFFGSLLALVPFGRCVLGLQWIYTPFLSINAWRSPREKKLNETRDKKQP